MHGFFAHQFLSFKKDHMRNLIALSRADGQLHEKEREMVFRIGRRYGLKDRQVEALLQEKSVTEVSVPEKNEDKLNTLYDLLLMVYADGVVEDSEVAYCENVVEKFGLPRELVRWMMTEVFVNGEAPAAELWTELREEAIGRFG